MEDVLSCPTHSWVDQVGDYWVIYLLSKNLSPVAMKVGTDIDILTSFKYLPNILDVLKV